MESEHTFKFDLPWDLPVDCIDSTEKLTVTT